MTGRAVFPFDNRHARIMPQAPQAGDLQDELEGGSEAAEARWGMLDSLITVLSLKRRVERRLRYADPSELGNRMGETI